MKDSVKSVTDYLLDAVEHEALPPDVFAIWLTARKSPTPLADALKQLHSKHIRAAAMVQFGKALRSPSWETSWNEVGGTDGLLLLLAHLSVFEVKALCKAIGRSAKWLNANDFTKQQRITELLKGLLPRIYPENLHKTTDERPLVHYYAQITPACTSEFVYEILLRNGFPFHPTTLPARRIVQAHFELLRRLSLGIIRRENTHEAKDDCTEEAAASIVTRYLPHLLHDIPQMPSNEQGLSASMAFSMAVLQEMATDQDAFVPHELFPKLTNPLLLRLKSRWGNKNRIKNLIDLAIKYLRLHPDAYSEHYFSSGQFVCNVAQCWSDDPQLFARQLVELVSLQKYCKDKSLSNYEGGLNLVKRPLRYRLLQIIVLHSEGIRLDLDSDEGLCVLPIETWPINLFKTLQPDHAANLLQRLIRLKAEGSLLPLSYNLTILSHPIIPNLCYADPYVLLTFLQRGQETAVKEAQRRIESSKRKASKSRDQADREFFAKSATYYAIASGSLELYDDVVMWSRRFLRDALTVKALYHTSVTTTSEGIALLTGVPEDTASISASQARSRLSKANEIILHLFESAVISLREPSFHSADWTGPLSLFRQVVIARMKRAGELKYALGLSEDELYELLWMETLEILLRVERTGLEAGHEALNFGSPHGPLSFRPLSFRRYVTTDDLDDVDPALPSSYRFIDNLAKARNELWKEIRPTVHPTTAALPRPWPRGLPIQCLASPFDLATDSASGHLPFISSQATTILDFQLNNVIGPLPDDQDTRIAIGEFVDSFDVALKIDAMQHAPGRGRDLRARALLSNAIAFSGGRMSDAEGIHFWRPIFHRTLPSVKLSVATEECPLLPDEAEPHQPLEWDPTSPQFAQPEPWKLDPVALDCMLKAPSLVLWRGMKELTTPDPGIHAMSVPNIWSREMLEGGKLNYAVRNGLIVSALLFLNSKIPRCPRILAAPFPSNGDVRYPPLFLDQTFLAREPSEKDARGTLLCFIRSVPPSLLLSLTIAALNLLSATPDTSASIAPTERTAYNLLSLLAVCGRPQLASDLILRTIIDHPESSSWHRRLLTRKFLRTLPAQQAKDLVNSLAISIHGKLEEQSKIHQSGPVPNDSDSLKASDSILRPIIKITTVKLLAQLLEDADAISARNSISLLSDIFHVSAQLDIRVAVVGSIFGRLGHGPVDDVLSGLMLSALEGTIPALGSLNERQAIREEDWVQAEESDKLLEVYDNGDMEALPPLLDLVCDMVVENRIESNGTRRGILKRILLPAVEVSIANNSRWVRLFIKRHLPTFSSENLPIPPVKPRVLARLLTHPITEMPKSILELWQRYVLINLNPFSEIDILNKKVNEDSSLRDSDEGQHWLSLFGRGPGAFRSCGFNLADKLVGYHYLSQSEIELQDLQSLILEQISTLIYHCSDVDFACWYSFIAALEPVLALHEGEQEWLRGVRPVFERIVQLVDDLRTESWRNDPNRQPPILPLTFGIKLWLLSYPQFHSTGRQRSDARTTFAKQLAASLREVSDLGLAHHGKLDDVKEAALRCAVQDRAYVACQLGRIDEATTDRVTVQDTILRAELAETLFDSAGTVREDEEVKKEIDRVLATWQASRLEEVRMSGWRVAKILKDRMH
ncbi:hypothetical protein MMC20_005383 [Loxospora ochrophaea]|nr:hypothetical protein [Loxospora ochrophaea]